ncbi:hypothetical protein NDU88_009439 [Pleurodeles waltl]|uniref:Fibronectin type-III domain-containing protein n=2 Tax=Pleurodeles waltl TaxID=8319 RepID=A0AAV7NZ62_PLEWA|nr:hypothetical protein NDU88_009439 [Pleurodeles waltl]
MLYDCRSDELIPGVTLWNNETLQMDVATTPQPKTEFQIITSDRIEEKASSLGVSASLKASFLGGLVEVNGSASYLNDKKTSEKQARVSLQYSTTTIFHHLTMTHLGRQNVSYPDVFDQGTATHVVSAVLYGAQAFFVFDCDFSSSESIQDIQGNLEMMIQKIPTIALEGEGSLKMSDKEFENTEKFTCKFYGDFSLDSNPTTYQEAIKIYSTLPKLLGERGEKAVPVKVWLYPLKQIDPKAAQVVHDISIKLVFDVQAVLEKMSEINMQCNDLMMHPAAITFPEIRSKVQQFQEFCKQYTLTFQKQLAETLPSIRGGKKEECALVNILMSQRHSPFNFQSLSEFLDDKLQEMDFVNSYITLLKDVRVIATESELNRIILNPNTEYVVAFTFTSLKDIEPFLAALKDWLQAEFNKKVNGSKAQSDVSQKEKTKQWVSQSNISKTTRKYVKAFQEFFILNKSRKDTQFIVSSVSDQSNPGAFLYLYEAGDLLSTKFEPPSKPNPPLPGRITHNSVELKLRPSEFGQEAIEMYKIEYRTTNKENWADIRSEQKTETFTINGLKPNSEYEFRYYAECKAGLSAASDIKRAAKTLPTSPPGAPASGAVYSEAITLTWKVPSVIADGVTISDYEIEYRRKGGEGTQERDVGWFKERVGEQLETFTIKGLDRNTSYLFRVYAICKDVGVSAPSESVGIITTADAEEPRIAQTILEGSTQLNKDEPSIYMLPTVFHPDGVYRKHTMGTVNMQQTHKVIMVLGATGSGKTTLINGMINYILGVEWKDNFRFKLINEVLHRSQAHSQTSEVTAYEIHFQIGFHIPYSLTIIDTPGFGDTRGIEQDKKITQNIREFFSKPGGIDQLDAVCCVVQASAARLTHAQKYVFDSVLSIFGKDIEENIQVLVTFADGQTPPVLDAIKASDVPCPKDDKGTPIHFKFNNSALFAGNVGREEENAFNFNEMFWRMGLMSMQTFFTSLSSLQPKSLRLTKEVLKERRDLEVCVQGLQPQIKAGLIKLDELKKTQHALEQHKDEMKANQNFEYEVETHKQRKVEIQDLITNCSTCHFTCHHPCGIRDDRAKNRCSAMRDGNCTVCPGKCAWDVHFNQAYKFEYYMEKEKKTYAELKARYESASGEVMTVEKVFEELLLEYDAVQNTVVNLIEKSSSSLRRLQEIALKPNPLATPEYIDLMIEAEERELKPGYKERIKALHEVREQAVLIHKIANNEKLLPEESKAYTSMKKKESKVTASFWSKIDILRSLFKSSSN